MEGEEAKVWRKVVKAGSEVRSCCMFGLGEEMDGSFIVGLWPWTLMDSLPNNCVLSTANV